MNLRHSIALSALFTSVAASTAAAAEPQFVTESDSGMMFGDLDCRITSAEIDPVVRLSEDPFQYLYGTVSAAFTCVDRSGITHRYSGQDTVLFPLAELDWASQTWRVNGKVLARRNPPYGVILTEETTAKVQSYTDEAYLTFKVELWQ